MLARNQLAIYDKMLPYLYQQMTYQNISVSRHRQVINFSKLPRIKQVMLRFMKLQRSIPRMNVFATYFRFVNMMRLSFCWLPFPRAKSLRWKRKFGVPRRKMYGRVLFTPAQFCSFWLLYISVYVSRRVFRPIKRRMGTGSFVFQWMRRHELFWRFPAVPDFVYLHASQFNARSPYYIKIMLTRYRRFSFIQDRDIYRLLNYPVFYHTVPRMWQPDPSKFVFYFRSETKQYQQYVL